MNPGDKITIAGTLPATIRAMRTAGHAKEAVSSYPQLADTIQSAIDEDGVTRIMIASIDTGEAAEETIILIESTKSNPRHNVEGLHWENVDGVPVLVTERTLP
jgi:hypothetical protein